MLAALALSMPTAVVSALPPSSGCPTPAPSSTQTVGGHTYALEGMDTFTKDAPVGSFANTTDGQIVYTGDHGMGWTEYPDGWSSTYTGGAIGYQPSTVQSVHDGMLDFYLHNDAAGDPVGANPSPFPAGSRYQTYGVWSMCEKLAPGPGGLADFYQAPLLWPMADSNGSAAESDFPEGRLDATNWMAFAHNPTGQDYYSTGLLDTTQWHVYTETWQPGVRAYYVDGRLIGMSMTQVWSQPERYQLQIEPSGQHNGGSGHLYVGWFWIGT